MTNFLSKFKEPFFWQHFGPFSRLFWQKTFSRKTSYGFLAPCKNLEKTNNTISRKRQDRRKDGQQTLFHGILPTTAVGPKTYIT